MNRETWKAQERDYAKQLHGKRIPVTGRSGSDVPDITSHTIVGEVKKSSTGKAVSLKTMKALRISMRPICFGLPLSKANIFTGKLV